jgi:hypothetical protein
MVKSRRMRWACHIARMGELINIYIYNSGRKTWRKRLLGRPRCRWKDNIWIERAVWRGFVSRQGLKIFLFTTASRPALGLIQPSIQWVPGSVSLGVKRPGRKADHSPPSSAEDKEYVELYLHSPNTPSWRGAQLKRRDNFREIWWESVDRTQIAQDRDQWRVFVNRVT